MLKMLLSHALDFKSELKLCQVCEQNYAFAIMGVHICNECLLKVMEETNVK